jgi:plasmid stability protein
MVDMASLTLRNIDDSIKTSLRISAAEHGRSMEEEARQILKHFLLRKRSSAGIGSCISRRFAAIGGVDLSDVHRSGPRRPPTFIPDDAQ